MPRQSKWSEPWLALAGPAAGHQRLLPLDGLRCLAILAVFGNHAASRVVPGGMIGVTIFFALSGYLITTLLLQEHSRFGTIRIGRFLYRRALRLAPALIVAAAVLPVPAHLLGYAHPIGDSVAAVTYVSNFYSAFVGVERGTIGHSWSLSVEQQFYLLWPPLLLLVLTHSAQRRTLLLVSASWCIALTAGTLLALLAGAPLSVLYLLPTTRLPEILAGCLLAIALKSGLAPKVLALTRPTWLSGAVLFLLIAAMFGLDLYNNRLMYVGGYTTVALATCLVIAHVVARPDSLVARLLSLRWIVWMGTISYSFYLWHYVAIVLTKLIMPVAPAIIVGFFLATGLGYASYRFIEVPFNRLRRASPRRIS